MGGSTTNNSHAWNSVKTDYSAALQSILTTSLPNRKIEVLNAGVEGFSSAHSLVNYALRVSAFAPDLIIVMHNINDRSVAYFGGETTPDYSNKYMDPIFIAPELQRFRGVFGTVAQSRVLTRLGMPELLSKSTPDYGADMLQAKKYFDRNLKSIAELARSDGVAVVFLTQPYNRSIMTSTALQHHIEFNKVITHVAEQTHSSYFDMAAELSGQEKYFIDSVHYSVDGVKQLAKLLSPFITELLINSD